MKVIIAGGRDFNDYEKLKSFCNHILQRYDHDDIEIVCGMARGADLLGKKYAEEYNFKLAKFPANWDKFGKRAGYLRNAEMAEYADALIAFWDGSSKGTQHMINLAKERNLKIRIIKY